ncbi:hypothetical protein ACFSC3_03690 [Sphingomonas floccifaciens]|uniref:TonB-dependent receptor n=1 Tax=Sphingomonas floccifaciens TaxID=1844115 RepID=A0ABW4NB14_9SPHN
MTYAIRLGRSVLATAAIVAGCGEAGAQNRFSADVSTGASVATNPYLQDGQGGSSESVFVEVAPVYVIQGPTTVSRLSGQLRVEPFLRRYSTDTLAAVNFDRTSRVSDRFVYRSGINFVTSRASALNALFLGPNGGAFGGPIGGTTGGTVGIDPTTLPVSIDPSYLGRPQRTTSASINAGVSYITGPRGSLDVDLSAQAQRFDDATLGEYNFATQRIQYGSRRSDRTTLTAGVTFGQSNYLGTQLGDGYTISPILGINTQLSPTIKASVGGGVSYARFRRLQGDTGTITAFALQAQICKTHSQGRYCLNADRSVQPTALGSLRTLTGVFASYDNRLNENDRLSLSASYNVSEESAESVGIPTSSFIGARAELSHRISRRLDVFGSAAYADILQAGITRRPSIQGRVGIRFRVGSLE